MVKSNNDRNRYAICVHTKPTVKFNILHPGHCSLFVWYMSYLEYNAQQEAHA